MKELTYQINAKVWLWEGASPWHFVTIEKEDADEIRKEEPWPRKGFGSIPVHVTIGKTTWKTSIFPEKKGSYVLPLKKEVRDRENIQIGGTVLISLVIIN